MAVSNWVRVSIRVRLRLAVPRQTAEAMAISDWVRVRNRVSTRARLRLVVPRQTAEAMAISDWLGLGSGLVLGLG